jgi:hypothetical protein
LKRRTLKQGGSKTKDKEAGGSAGFFCWAETKAHDKAPGLNRLASETDYLGEMASNLGLTSWMTPARRQPGL